MTFATMDVRVGNLMTIEPVLIDACVGQRGRALTQDPRMLGVPGASGGATTGVISQTDLVGARSSGMISGSWERVLVRHLMTTPPSSPTPAQDWPAQRS